MAIIVGSTPVIMIVASAPIPYGRYDELAVAGGIMLAADGILAFKGRMNISVGHS